MIKIRRHCVGLLQMTPEWDGHVEPLLQMYFYLGRFGAAVEVGPVFCRIPSVEEVAVEFLAAPISASSINNAQLIKPMVSLRTI